MPAPQDPAPRDVPAPDGTPPWMRTVSSRVLLVTLVTVGAFILGMGYLVLEASRATAHTKDPKPLEPPSSAQLSAALAGAVAAAEAEKRASARAAASEAFPAFPPPPTFQPQPYEAFDGEPQPAPQRERQSGPTALDRAFRSALIPTTTRGQQLRPSQADSYHEPPKPPPVLLDPTVLTDRFAGIQDATQGPDARFPSNTMSDASSSGKPSPPNHLHSYQLSREAVAHPPVQPYVLRAEPSAPFTIQQGSVLPAVLLGSINSELPGQTTARLARGVYDSAAGRHLLLPQGTLLLGQYDSRTVLGQRRLFVAWTRAILPGGASFELPALPAVDAGGATGLRDKVDSHFVRIFGSALLLSAISAGVQLSQPQESADGRAPSASQVAAAAVGQELGRVSTNIIGRSLNAAPTLHIRRGHRFNIEVTRDLVLEQPWEYSTTLAHQSIPPRIQSYKEARASQ